MEALEVGKKYDRFRKMPEGASLNINELGMMVLITMPNITKSEVETINKGQLKYYLTEYKEILYLVLDYGHLSFDIGYNRKDDPDLEDIKDDKSGYAVTIVLADTVTGEVKSIRLISLSNHFSKTLKNVIERQERLSVNKTMLKAFEIQSKYSIDQIIRAHIIYSKITS